MTGGSRCGFEPEAAGPPLRGEDPAKCARGALTEHKREVPVEIAHGSILAELGLADLTQAAPLVGPPRSGMTTWQGGQGRDFDPP